jgi:hypothetical protein
MHSFHEVRGRQACCVERLSDLRPRQTCLSAIVVNVPTNLRCIRSHETSGLKSRSAAGPCHASKERVFLFGTDQRITSGPAARTAAFKGRIHGCTRTIRGNVRFSSCTAGAVHTWHFATDSHLIGDGCFRAKRTCIVAWLRSSRPFMTRGALLLGGAVATGPHVGFRSCAVSASGR